MDNLGRFFQIVVSIVTTVAASLAALLLLLQFDDVSQDISLKIVTSGSMEPAITTGSLLVVARQDQYHIGDIITFGEGQHPDAMPTTHRIVAVQVSEGQTAFVTQGDANQSKDKDIVPESAVIGRVILSVPYLGYLLDFAQRPVGFVLIIVLPAVLVVFDELSSLWQQFSHRQKQPIDN